MLRPFVLTGHNGIGREMGDANGRISLIDMLPTSTAGPIGIDLEVFFVDFNFNFVGQFGENKNRAKGRMPPGTRIKGRIPHQPMDADL